MSLASGDIVYCYETRQMRGIVLEHLEHNNVVSNDCGLESYPHFDRCKIKQNPYVQKMLENKQA